MCGIAGLWGGEPQEVAAAVSDMVAALHHRGPDERGVHADGSLALGHARLSIIDLGGGHQPMFNEDHSVAVVFNGEIYNFMELRKWLEGRGHAFRTRSDTECLVHLYEEVGPDLVHYLRGMFAFSVWDARHRRLVLARDRLGIKPLYWYADGARFAFASEASALFAARAGLDDATEPIGLRLYFSLGYIPSPMTAWQKVRKLPPGHVLVVDDPTQAPRLRRYWDLRRIQPVRASEGEALERLGELVDDAVRMRLIADVPLGAFLSGGIDSSIVVAAMRRHATGVVKTYSIGFTEADHDELPFARAAARHLGVEHTEEVLSPDAIGLLGRVAQHFDEPFGDSSALPTYCVSEMARKHVTVALSGDGGDEIFGGYARYARQAWVDAASLIPRPVLRWASRRVRLASGSPAAGRTARLLARAAASYPDRYADSVIHFPTQEERNRLFTADLVARDDAVRALRALGVRGSGRAAMQRIDALSYLPEDILTKVDRMSMAVGLEARVPLLDHRLVEFALSLPPRLHGQGMSLKRLLKKLYARDFPAEWATRRKQGFAVPLGKWFRGPLRVMVRDVLLDQTALARGIWTRSGAEALLAEHDAGTDRSAALWLLVMFELWARQRAGARR